MSMQDGQFANEVKATLTDQALGMVNFRARSRTIATMNLTAINACIITGQISCKVDPSQIPGPASAIYSPGNRTIYGRSAQAAYADERQTYVHESTHAYIHLSSFSNPVSISVLDNEILAFLAGALYVAASGQTPSYQNKGPISAAFTLAKKKIPSKPAAGTTNSQSLIEFDDSELTDLITAIKADVNYNKTWNNSHTFKWPS